MKKLNSKMFQSLKLTNDEAKKCLGGMYTSKDSDTSQSGYYDVTFATTDANGGNQSVDAVFTGQSTEDAPSKSTLTDCD